MAKDNKELVIPKPKIKGLHVVMKESMYDYGMEVIHERSTPRITDGLMPVERRIIYGMFKEGITHTKPFKKAAKSVGVVMGGYHPHGDTSIYGTMIKLSQDWKLPATLIDPHGANGDVMGGSAAAMRYVELRLGKMSTLFTDDLKYNPVVMQETYDSEDTEPTELPTKLPSLLINGSRGIGVGFAATIPQHNYHDSITLCKAFNRDRNMDIDQMIDIIKAPDFPCGGTVNGLESVHKGYKTSSGSCLMKGTIEKTYDERKRAWTIDTTSLPPETGHETYVAKLKRLVEDGLIRVREKVVDLSDGKGVRIRLALHKSEEPGRVENLLLAKAGLQAASNMTLFALIDGIPRNITLYDMVAEFIKFRERIIFRKSKHQLQQVDNDLHMQKGLAIAFENIDNIIKIIRNSKKDIEALPILMKKFKLSEKQATYILDIKLRRLTSLEGLAVEKKIKELNKRRAVLLKITKSSSNKYITDIIEEELTEAFEMKKYAPRKCKIVTSRKEIDVRDAIKDEPRTMVLTRNGRLKNMEIKLEPQGRLGVGSTFISQDDDEPEIITPTTTTSTVFCFTNTGKVYAVNPYKIEVSSKYSRGKLAKTELNLNDKEYIIYMKSVPKDFDPKGKYLVFFTQNGLIKVTKYEEYASITKLGKKAIKLVNGDKLVSVSLWDKSKHTDAMISTDGGYSLRLGLDNVTSTGRDTTGVIGIKMKDKNNSVIGGIILESELVYFINKEGQIKKVSTEDFAKQSRGGYGMLSGSDLISTLSNSDDYDQISVFTKLGMSISIEKSSIRKVKRTAVGVKSIKLNKKDTVLKMFQS